VAQQQLREVRLVTFDVYSALMNIEAALMAHTAAVWPYRSEAERAALVREWRRLQLEYTLISTLLGKGHLSFRTITQRALRVAMHRLHFRASQAEQDVLVQAWDELPPWPEARDVLRRLRQGPWELALLSNGDTEMLQAVANTLGVDFDYIFSAEQAGVYKPHVAIYHLPVKQLGLSPHEIVHVAGAARDAMGAKAAGLRCVWVNRSHDLILDPSFAPDVELATLEPLPEVLTG